MTPRQRAPLGVVQPGEHGHPHGRDRYPYDCGCSACATDWWDAQPGSRTRTRYGQPGSGAASRAHGTVGRWAMGCRCPKCVAAWDTYRAAGGNAEWVGVRWRAPERDAV